MTRAQFKPGFQFSLNNTKYEVVSVSVNNLRIKRLRDEQILSWTPSKVWQDLDLVKAI